MRVTSYDLLTAWAALELLEDRIAVCVDAEERGYLEQTIAAQLAGLAQDTRGKLDALRAVVLRSRAEQAMLRAEEKHIAARRKSSARVETRCMANMAALLEAGGSVRTETASYRMQAGPPRVVGPDDVAAWGEQEWTRVTVAPDKVRALAALKAMEPDDRPEGFSLTRGMSARW